MPTINSYPSHQHEGRKKVWRQGIHGFRNGQGPFSKKKWVRNLFLNYGRKKDLTNKKDVLDLFSSATQARAFLRKLARYDAREQEPPFHIKSRAVAAKLYLAELGEDWHPIYDAELANAKGG